MSGAGPPRYGGSEGRVRMPVRAKAEALRLGMDVSGKKISMTKT